MDQAKFHIIKNKYKARIKELELELEVSSSQKKCEEIKSLELQEKVTELGHKANYQTLRIEELRKLQPHDNGTILLGWMDAHKKVSDERDKAEAMTAMLQERLHSRTVMHKNAEVRVEELMVELRSYTDLVDELIALRSQDK